MRATVLAAALSLTKIGSKSLGKSTSSLLAERVGNIEHYFTFFERRGRMGSKGDFSRNHEYDPCCNVKSVFNHARKQLSNHFDIKR